MNNITLDNIRSNINWEYKFFKLYEQLVVSQKPNLEDKDKQFLLKLAIIYLNQEDKDLNKFGYRIILEYSIKFNDFAPLYEIAISQGYIPIAKFIENKYFLNSRWEDKFYLNWLSAFCDIFKKNNKYLSCQQKNY